MLALMEGRFEEAEQLIVGDAGPRPAGRELERRRSSERLALFVLRREQGRLAELEDTIAPLGARVPGAAAVPLRAGAPLRRARPRARGARGSTIGVARPRPGARRRRVAVQHEPACPTRARSWTTRTPRRSSTRCCSPTSRSTPRRRSRELRLGGAGPRRPAATLAASKTPSGTSSRAGDRAEDARATLACARAEGLRADAARPRGSPRRGACPGAT